MLVEHREVVHIGLSREERLVAVHLDPAGRTEAGRVTLHDYHVAHGAESGEHFLESGRE
ncbi:hypothetical protein GCM10010216_62940 [Streptomyces flaveolus]|nr:hypothetical protein GCM10010216_62940 [Streptomyces flaveolus]